MAQTTWKGWHTAALLVLLVALPVAGMRISAANRLAGWLVILALLALFAAVVGKGITGLWRGLLINDENKISLSQLQMVVWTLVVLSGYFCAALANLALRQPDPMAVALPETLWLLMGISTTSLLASPLLKSTKRDRPADDQETIGTLNLLAKRGTDVSRLDTKGQLLVNSDPGQARWSDLFQGEETGNGAHLDIGKLQLFYFTVVLVFAYCLELGREMGGGGVMASLPDLGTGMITLLGISHAGYLSNKAVPHSAAPQ